MCSHFNSQQSWVRGTVATPRGEMRNSITNSPIFLHSARNFYSELKMNEEFVPHLREVQAQLLLGIAGAPPTPILDLDASLVWSL